MNHSYILKGKVIGLLAENLAVSGPIELFGYAKTKNDMLVPIPLLAGALLALTATHDKYYWYVRTYGGALLEVPRGNNDFAKTMSTFLVANASLVARIQQKGEGAKFKDMVQLVDSFNGTKEVK